METKLPHTRSLALGVVAFACLAFTGCFISPVIPPVGVIYHQSEVPVDIAYDNNGVGTKTGVAQSESILGLVAFGDARISTAAANGGISTIDHVDADLFNILGVYQRYTTIVHGQ